MARNLGTILYHASGLIPAAWLTCTGISKLHDPFPTARFLSQVLFSPLMFAGVLGRCLGGFELALVVLLCLQLSASRFAAFLSLALQLAYLAMIAELFLLWPKLATCACTGSISGLPVQLDQKTETIMLGAVALFLAAHMVLFPREDK